MALLISWIKRLKEFWLALLLANLFCATEQLFVPMAASSGDMVMAFLGFNLAVMSILVMGYLIVRWMIVFGGKLR